MARIQLRRGSSNWWVAENPILAAGEPGVELDTRRLKIGDGVTPWILLPFLDDGTGEDGETGPASYYIHDQSSAMATWTIVHNLGYYPAVTVVNSAEQVVAGRVTYLSANVVRIEFSAPFGGRAYLS